MTLVSLADSSRNVLETVQNAALRLKLGAPSWTKLETLRAETGLPPLTVRVEQLAAALVARTITRPTDIPARQCFLSVLPQDHNLFAGRAWLRGFVRATHNALSSLDLTGRGTDERTAGYVDPPPCAAAVARYHISPLPSGKSLSSP